MKIWKKVLGWMLCVMMVTGMLPMMEKKAQAEPVEETTAVDTDESGIKWDGDKNCYVISNYAGLVEFARIVNDKDYNPNGLEDCSSANAVLVAVGDSIDASASALPVDNPNRIAWTPIGTEENPYKGTFDGNGCKIINLNIDSGSCDIGLFGYVEGVTNDEGEIIGGIIQNVALEGGVIVGWSFVGGIIGYNLNGVVLNCYNTGAVNGRNFVGGVVGYNSGTVSTCYNTGDVSGQDKVGGVVGEFDGSVSNCYNTGDVSGQDKVGGVVGYYSSGTVSTCYNAGDVTGVSNFGDVTGVSNFGGVIGYSRYGNDLGRIKYCYYDESVCSTVGGAINGYNDDYHYVIGLTTDDMTGRTSSSYNRMDGFFNSDGTSSAWMGRKPDSFYFYYPHLKGFNMDAFGNQLDADNIRKTDWAPRMILKDVMEISNYDELKEFASKVNGGTAYLNGILLHDIDASASTNGNAWTPIGTENTPYSGIFDGNGYKINGLTLDASSTDYVGLFGFVGDTTPYDVAIRNVGMEGGLLSGKDFVGGLVGYIIRGIVENCYNTGDVKGVNNVGGVIGLNNCTVSNCYSTGDVEELDSFVGGVVGGNSGTVLNCYNTGDVEGGDSCVGGVVGDNYGTVTNCYNTGAVNGRNSVGGVIGCNNNTVSNCFNTGDVEGGNNVGGVAGLSFGVNNKNAIIQNCYNTGAVTGQGYVGGVAGTNRVIKTGKATVQNSYNIGGVSGLYDIGGVVGSNVGNGLVQNCYNTGGVNGNNAGGVAGNYTNGTVKNCYYDSSMCINGAVNGDDDSNNSVLGLTSVQMTGEGVIGADSSMKFTWEEGESSPWLEKADSDCDGKHYFYYPHLKGFDWKNEKGNREEFPLIDAGSTQMSAEEIDSVSWPAKVEVSVTWDKADSYVYDGTPQGPTVKKVTVGDADIPEGSASVAYFVYEGGKWIEIEGEPNNSGTYKMRIALGDSEETITKYFAILDADLYPVTYDDSSTEGCINAGDHIAVITFEEYEDESEDGNTTKRSITEPFTINQAKLTIKAESESFVYDGKSHSNFGYTVTGLQGKDAVTVVVSGSIMFPREKSVANVVKSYTFTTGSAKNYDIKTENGTLTMTAASVSITITAASGKATYDGKAFSDTKVTVTKGNLLEGDVLVAQATGSVTNVADSQKGNNKIAAGYKIMHDTEDVTENYVIAVEDGTLTINPKPITDESITLEYEAEAEYTGSNIEPSVVVKDGENKLVEGTDYTVSYVNNACVVHDSAGNVIAGAKIIITGKGNYSDAITVSFMITPKELTITAESDSKEYDGTALTKNSYEYTDLVKGDRLESVTITGSQTDAGNSKNSISNAKIVHGDDDVTGCYEITYVDGTLTVTNASAPELSDLEDGEKPVAAADLVENGEKQQLLTAPEMLPGGYTMVEYSIDGGKTWTTEIPAASESGTYTIKTRYIADDNHTDFEGETYKVTIKALYTVIWKDDAGNVLDQKTYVEGETEPTTDKTPVKAADADNTYVFKAWKQPGKVDGKTTTYEPEFEQIPKDVYTVVWLNGDGSILDSKTYKEDEIEPTTDKTPVKAADADNTYVFKAWKQPGKVDGKTTTYEPEFEQIAKVVYTVEWLNGDGMILDSKTYKEDEKEPTTDKTPVKANDDEYKYLFDSWKIPGTVNGTTTTYEPVFIAIPLEMYYLVQDGDIEWEQGTDGTITFIVKRKQDDANCIKYFRGIRIGNVLLVQGYYDLVSGSTVITLKNDYLKTLAPGTYTVEIEFEDGLVTTQIKVLEEKKKNTPTPEATNTPTPKPTATNTPTPTSSPSVSPTPTNTPIPSPTPEPSPTPVPVEPSAKTGDTSNLWLWAILAVIAAGTLGGVVAEKRVRKEKCR